MFKALFDYSYKEFKRIEKIANKVLAYEPKIKDLSDEDLKGKTKEFQDRINNGETLDAIMVEAFAVIREAAFRVLKMKPYKVQIIGATCMHYGNISEMKTGEGKTITATLTAYLNSLSGDGVHVITVNEYLASRDKEEMGILFEWLGLSVGLNLRELTKQQKREQYECDIMYTTNSELGFDYLRDHMVMYEKDITQSRGLKFAIIDEVDSILIDEARTPLIISGGQKSTANLYENADKAAKILKEEHYDIDLKSRHVSLTESGISMVEKIFNLENLYDVKHVQFVHRLNNALKANYIFTKDIEYVVNEDEVLIVDSFTGRIMKGRQYSDGLHQAIEAKESVKIKDETSTVATITYQNFFRMYDKLSGMTGTAKTEEEEFRDIYNMYVIEIPTNKEIIRNDAVDIIYANMDVKYKHLCEEIKDRNKKGQPILVGTNSIESSEEVSKRLKKMGIKFELLNAKQHEREGKIVENAGQKGAITIATNMAGRGTDIKLGVGVKELGGLAVLGAERNESRRIDNQLRGRAGRQGDPGFSRFFISSDDIIIRRFGQGFADRVSKLTKVKGSEDKPLESKLLSRLLRGAQTRIEGSNYDTRKNILKYDGVLSSQRDMIYKQREEILLSENLDNAVNDIIKNAVDNIILKSTSYDDKIGKNILNKDILFKIVSNEILPKGKIEKDEIENSNNITELLYNKAIAVLEAKKSEHDTELFQEFLKVVLLRVVDSRWTAHIDQMAALRQSIGLQSYGQINPIREYQNIGFDIFEQMTAIISIEALRLLMRAVINRNQERESVNKVQKTNDGKEHLKSSPKKVVKIGRNDTCSCGSGKKYKDCCGK